MRCSYGMKSLSILFTTVATLSSVVLSTASAVLPQIQTLPGSVIRGERVLTSNGCLSCHSLKGQGATRAPDLSVPSKNAATPALFASSLWNHMPSMLSEMQALKVATPALRIADTADLFAYFYSTLYFSPRGNATRGGSVFVSRQCSSCHSEVLNTDRRAGLRETWMDLKDPSVWAERMWNHATEMESAMSNRGIRWPKLSDQDVSDLVTFLASRGGSEAEAYELSIGEPDAGRAVFDRSCTSCHTLGQRERSKVDLLARTAPPSVTAYIAAMWNHAPEMKRKGGSTPKLASGDMADLVAFLFSQRYFFEPGDAQRGKKVYEDKNCELCHDVRRPQTGAPDLAKSMEAFSPIVLTAAAWQHGIPMMQAMKQQGVDWPQFKGREMADLIAFLNSRVIVRVAPR